MRARMLAATTLAALALPATAAAHVEIVSTEVGEGALYTVTTPNENTAQDMTGLRLTVPDGLEVSAIADASGFTAEIVRDQSGRAVALSWQGGSLKPEHLGLFSFAGHLDAGVDRVKLTGTQSFADGSSTRWTPEIQSTHWHGESDTPARALAGAALAVGALSLSFALRRRSPAT